MEPGIDFCPHTMLHALPTTLKLVLVSWYDAVQQLNIVAGTN